MVTGAFFPEVSGGGLQCKTLIEALRENIRPYVITTSAIRKSLRRGRIDGIEVFRIYLDPRSFISKFRAFFNLLLDFLKIQSRIDIIQLNGFTQKNIPIILLAKLFRKRILQKLTSVGCDDPLAISMQRWGKIKLFFFSRADGFVSVSPGLTDRFLGSCLRHKRLYFIPNGVNTRRFYPLNDNARKIELRKELGLKSDTKLILFVGFFSYDKAPDLLLNSWLDMDPEIREKTQLLFVGATSTGYYEISENLVKGMKFRSSGLENKESVKFIEKILDIEKCYQAADIFVLPSRREGLPNALLEAMSCGLACIAAYLKGVTDYLINDGENGLLFESGNAKALTDKLTRLLKQDAYCRQIGIRASAEISDKFSLEKLSRRYLDAYEELLPVKKRL
ncbi:MAG: glycosyltransferase family 4 protein [Candidatus Omnitrophota bacterium]|nr:glycosyltransferase family 4 protein [Candidatus Omnitrophota bacterium]